MAEQFERALMFAQIPNPEAHTHASRMLDDLTRFPIEGFQLLHPVPISPVEGIIEYEFGRTAYSIDNAKPEDAPDFNPSDHGGTQLDRENILFLARTFEIARSVVPDLWLKPTADLIGQITAPRQHLDTLNEFWWLSRWRPGAKIERSIRINPQCGMDVDWQLSWDMGIGNPLVVNLEVKRRVGCDVLRFAQGGSLDPNQLFAAGLHDKKGNCKFRASGADEINVLGLTLLGEIDREVQDCASEWIKARNDIDALLLFSRFSARHSGFNVQVVRKRELLHYVLVRELAPLDQRLHSRVSRPLPFSHAQLPFLP